MARVSGLRGDFCIQRFEASLTVPMGWLTPHDGPVQQPLHVRFVSQAGRVPTHGLSWYQAASACLAYGYHLCTSQEWEDACDGTPGPGGRAHPVADGVRPDVACNIRHGQDGAIAASGRSPECHTPEGVYDLEGNLWEWVDPQRTAADGTPVTDKRGGGFYSGDTASCGQAAVGSHAPTWDGTIGFRCCTAVQDASTTPHDQPVPSGG
jgi:formylglycine-generating enzyme required for sulfatase activity